MSYKYFLLFISLFLGSILCQGVSAQPRVKLVTVIVSPNHADWTYNKGESAEFKITVLKNEVPLNGIKVEYKIMPEKMDPIKSGTETIKKESVTVKSGKIKKAGFIRCLASVEVDGKEYHSTATAGFSPGKIEPTTQLPNDFKAFWNNAKKELAKIPVKPVLTLIPERCTDAVDVYHVRLDNIQGKIYGILCKPKKPGKYPAILHVPGAGVRPYYGDVENAAKGVITFQIGIHGIPVNLKPEVYNDLKAGVLRRYTLINLGDKDKYYYKRVYLGCVRAVDFIFGLDAFDGKNIAVTGGSQGGALSIITTGLDKRIKSLAALYPALCDLTGYLHGRAGGWPHLFRDEYTNKPEKIETSKYYDVVNFARFVKVPGWYSWGYNDPTCPPTSMYSAYNVIKAPKELHIFQETGHWSFPEQIEMRYEWLLKQLKK
ncbi:MAG: acetylxylan esterase [Chlorobi bacterium]|nr:acetylxylan esterase [Chlorobiota bacterium]